MSSAWTGSSPARVIGTDEAGYGPNLGPLVIAMTAWDLPGATQGEDLWDLLAAAVSPVPAGDGRLQIADSKQVFQPGRGLAPLETPVLALLAVCGHSPRSLSGLRQALGAVPVDGNDDFAAPWYADPEFDVALPIAVCADVVEAAAERLRAALRESGVRLRTIGADVMTESRFNRLADRFSSKGGALTEATLALMRTQWDPAESIETVLIGDKHGGRNRYAGALSFATEGAAVRVLEESRACSRYRVGSAEFRFESRGERRLPVAAASMTAKYVREAAMTAVNAYWRRWLPELRPTQGYPQDAVRFRNEIAAVVQRLEMPEDLYWRRR